MSDGYGFGWIDCLSVGLLAISLPLMLLNKVDFNNILVGAITIGILGVICLIGAAAPLIYAGSLAMLALSFGLLFLTPALFALSKIDFSGLAVGGQ